MRILKSLFIVFVMACTCRAFGAELSGTATVNVTGDTAAAAKEMAFNDARRQIIPMALSGVADSASVSVAVQNATNSELANLISASSIDGERFSDTTYAANITMTLDVNATRAWLNSHNIQNWINISGGAVAANRTVAYITLRYGLSDWAELIRMSRDNGIDMDTRYMSAGNITVDIPTNALNKFVSAIVSHGWQYANHGGILQIWR